MPSRTAKTLVVEPLMTALKEESHQVRTAAASALEAHPDSRALESLAAALSDPWEDVRLHSARALAANADERAMPSLIGLLQGSRFYIRRSAAEALEQRKWWPQSEAERGAWAAAHCAWGEATDCGAAAAGPLLAVINEAGDQCENADEAYRIDGAREGLEMVLMSCAAQIDESVLKELADTEVVIHYPVVTHTSENSTYFKAEEVSNASRIAELARRELERRHASGETDDASLQQ